MVLALTTAVMAASPDVAPCTKAKRLPSGRCAREETQRAIQVAYQPREDARKKLGGTSDDRTPRGKVKAAGKHLDRLRTLSTVSSRGLRVSLKRRATKGNKPVSRSNFRDSTWRRRGLSIHRTLRTRMATWYGTLHSSTSDRPSGSVPCSTLSRWPLTRE